MSDDEQPPATDNPTADGERTPPSTVARTRSRGTAAHATQPRETGGYDGPDPTRYGDWEHGGRCTDF